MLLKQLEQASKGYQVPLNRLLDSLPYNDDGLIAGIAQDAKTKDVLMLAWLNREAIEITLKEGQVCYFSRSRARLWRKGEESGHVQQLVEMRFDCDGDALLLLVNQTGPACHTNRSNCFYLRVDGNQVVIEGNPG